MVLRYNTWTIIMRHGMNTVALVWCATGIVLACLPLRAAAAREGGADERPVVIVPVQGEIEEGLVYVIRRGIREAEALRARALILDMDTYGGKVQSAEKIMQALGKAGVPTVTYVNTKAISAGALIAAATARIYMAPQSQIGDAKLLEMSPLPMLGAKEIDPGLKEKAYSAVRAMVRSACERNGHRWELFEAMMDEDALHTNLVAQGTLLTLTSQEAVTQGLAVATVQNRAELLELLMLSAAPLVTIQPKSGERVARFLNSMLVSGLLLMIGLGGIFVEFKSPGTSVPGIIGAVALGLFFWGHYVAGLSGWFELALFLVGLILIMIEIFIIPGFGATGISGILCMLAALVLAMVDWSPGNWSARPGLEELMQPVAIVAMGILGSLILLALVAKVMPRTPGVANIFLQRQMDATDGYTARNNDELTRWIGKAGVAKTILRPAGKALIEATLLDVVTDGGFITAGTAVKVVRADNNRLVVEQSSGA